MTTELKLRLENRKNRTEMTECYFTSPLKIGIPGHSGDRMKLVMMMASAGILKGDTFDYQVQCMDHTKALLTEQSYTKLFDMEGGCAKRKFEIQVGHGASLVYRPCAVIPFHGSHFIGTTQVSLCSDSEFFYSDILSAGRIGMGEAFQFEKYVNRTIVRVEDRPVWIDHCCLVPEGNAPDPLIYFHDFSHQGTFYYYGSMEKQDNFCLKLQEDLKEDGFSKKKEKTLWFGVSKAVQGVCVRILAHSAQDIEEMFESFEKILDIEC